ncbi:hypothetical protein AA980_22930 [Neobacillus vireti]|nr:hypothetical protein AA980_22930 [Neobacillus vireti]
MGSNLSQAAHLAFWLVLGVDFGEWIVKEEKWTVNRRNRRVKIQNRTVNPQNPRVKDPKWTVNHKVL